MKLCTGATGLVMETRTEFPSAGHKLHLVFDKCGSCIFVHKCELCTNSNLYVVNTDRQRGGGNEAQKVLAYLELKLPGTQLGRLKG
jgi:hypothetical protein